MCIFTGCGNEYKKNQESDKLKIVTTIFPEYDWVKQIMGEKADEAEITLLTAEGTDFHSYQPSVDDIIKISSCDILIYVGGKSDNWIKDSLKNATNKNMIVINLLDILGDAVKEEEHTEGIQEENHGNENNNTEYDEHVWLSLKNTKIICKYIAEKLEEINPENSDIYKTNVSSYIEKLDKLDEDFYNTVKNSEKTTILFADRFPFRYLTDDYGISYYAAFPGCSAESEASFETISFLAEKVNELNLSYVIILENSDKKIAETIISATEKKDAEILSLNSMQSVTEEDIKNGITYLSITETNLSVLKKALER